MRVVLALAVAFYPTNALSLSSNRVENELVQNGHSSFFRAARTSDIDYESYYAQRQAGGQPAAAARRNWRPTARRSRSWRWAR